MAELSVSMRAYCKLLLHAAKYPHCAVNGVLLAEDTKGKEHKSLKIVDCIPLFHITLGLAPMLEVALLQIDAFCRSKGYVIGGYYQANENYDDLQLNHIARTIGRKVNQNFPEACLFMIDNRRVSPDAVSEVYKVYSLQKNNWKELDNKRTVDEDTLMAACTLLKSEAFRKLLDYDNHLDDIKHDWRNPEVNDEITRCT
ncbi:ER membrane protein complex subunit 8-like [Gigantopelta aegis]|uniref:ER membrane protein complex subunit 8-like n=1 Tax=Gigantopelta aegis TaxID=1735272 RepID=UPI001B88C821|nr:ER membrane protein complex subunit 8-like [Gigantopelta aegis]